MDNNEKDIYAEIVFPIPINHPYTYIIPERFKEEVVPGVRALVPFGPRKTTGFIVNRVSETDVKELKEIEEVLDPIPLFTPEVLRLAKWIADYYLCGWGEVLKAALPAGIHLDSEKVIRLVRDNPRELWESLQQRAPKQAEIIRALMIENPLSMSKLKRKIGPNPYTSLKSLRQAGHVRMELSMPNARVRKKYEITVLLSDKMSEYKIRELADSVRSKAPKQAACLDFLLAYPNRIFTRTELAREAKVSSDVVKGLADRGIIELQQNEVWRDYYSEMDVKPPKILTLNADQKAALTAIRNKLDAREFAPFLLHGVTGSGKTQVYIEAIHHVLALGRTAIVLVPEIALTPQIVSRFRSHFGEKVAVFHSRMSPGERYDSWRRTWEGRHKIVIGPRSAIFAPMKNIGLIVVDEEHELSYKQTDMTPRYNARDIAIIRANIDKAVVVLGSATPAVESYYNAKIGKYKLLKMPRRIDDVPMPEIQIVDMKREPKITGRKAPIIFSRLLRQKIDEKLSKGEQIIIFQNRRGFATFLQCKACGYVAKCDNCDITLTYHLRGHILKCHYCGLTRRAPEVCPKCSGSDIFFKGVGTQRIEEELKELFPGVKAIRMDLDTTRGKRAHDKILSQFGKGEYQILLGTQMVAKGLDFPNVTLVGVISADTELFFPDFRAGERTFQLLTQVSGRSGRKDKLGEVIIQTFSHDHYSLYYTKKHDYESFFNTEMSDRRDLGYPPYSRIINILFKGENEDSVIRVAEGIAGLVPKEHDFKMLGPAPAPISKIQGNYRWQILFMSLKHQDAGSKRMKTAIRTALSEFKKKHRSKKVTLSIDVDPVSIL
ncbi:MAG: primosomal protein N' [Actinobacteria bacterium]|nr:primosomal protein N' [Actinomycetota bacterium]